jgi:hypothetical protein
MIRFRREFLKTAAVTATFASLPAQAAGAATQFGVIRRDGIATLFDDLPGDLGFKIHAPSPRGRCWSSSRPARDDSRIHS